MREEKGRAGTPAVEWVSVEWFSVGLGYVALIHLRRVGWLAFTGSFKTGLLRLLLV